MSTTIVSRTIRSILDKKLVCSNSQAAVQLEIGNAWNDLFIGTRLAFTDPGANVTGAFSLFGLISNPSAGMANGVLGSATSHFIGHYPAVFTQTFARQAGPPVNFTGGSLSGAKKIGSTISNSNGSGTRYSGDPTVRWPYVLRFLRSGGNISLSRAYPTNTKVPPDCSLSVLEEAIEGATTAGGVATALNATLGASAISSATDAAFAIDEATYGDLNAITLGWNRTTCVAEFSEIVFCVKS